MVVSRRYLSAPLQTLKHRLKRYQVSAQSLDHDLAFPIAYAMRLAVQLQQIGELLIPGAPLGGLPRGNV